MRIMVDPPNGWKYGFPKQFDPYRDGDIRKWLVANGYPQEEIDACKGPISALTFTSKNHKPEFIQGIPTLI